MKINGYKIQALFMKDVKNFFKNINVSFMLLMPIGFAFLYTKIIPMNEMGDGGALMVYNLCSLLTLGVVPISIVAMSIAEEKEKNTLRTLMLSNVTAVEFLVSKILVGLILAMIVNGMVFFIAGAPVGDFLKYMVTFFITMFSAVLFGAAIGLVSKDQMSTGYYATPVMLLFMAPMFGAMSESINKITQFIPTYSMMIFNNMTSFNEVFTSKGIMAIAVIVVWIIVSIVLFQYIYKRNRIDN